MLLILPKIKKETERCNFVFKVSSIWNTFIKKLLNKCVLNSEGIIIPGFVSGSDSSTSISFIKSKLKNILLETQKCDQNTQVGWSKSDEWYPEKFFSPD